MQSRFSACCSIRQILMTEWLGEKFNCSRLYRPHGHRDITMGSNRDDGNLNDGLCQFAR